jgi:hypothetical protein
VVPGSDRTPAAATSSRTCSQRLSIFMSPSSSVSQINVPQLTRVPSTTGFQTAMATSQACLFLYLCAYVQSVKIGKTWSRFYEIGLQIFVIGHICNINILHVCNIHLLHFCNLHLLHICNLYLSHICNLHTFFDIHICNFYPYFW